MIKIKVSLITISLLMIFFAINVNAARTPTVTTIPPIPAQSSGVQLQCFPLQAFPGSVTIGASGFIRIRCPDKNGAVQFGQSGVASTTLTPSLTLGLGYINASIMLSSSGGSPCNFNFGHLTVGNVTVSTGSFLNRGSLTFGNPPTDPSQLLASNYDYCLQYQNAPASGLAGFDIVWT